MGWFCWGCGCLTMVGGKHILEISQSTTDLWKTYFNAKNPVGLKIFKPAKNGITKPINDTAWFLFFTRVPEKGQKSRRFEKIAREPSQGAGTGRQSQSTKIPVRGLKRPIFLNQFFRILSQPEYQNPRKGTETPGVYDQDVRLHLSQSTKIPVRGLKLSVSSTRRFLETASRRTKIPGVN